MTVAEAKNVIAKINICIDTMIVLQKSEKESFYKDCFKTSEELLMQYRVLLEEKIEKAEL